MGRRTQCPGVHQRRSSLPARPKGPTRLVCRSFRCLRRAAPLYRRLACRTDIFQGLTSLNLPACTQDTLAAHASRTTVNPATLFGRRVRVWFDDCSEDPANGSRLVGGWKKGTITAYKCVPRRPRLASPTLLGRHSSKARLIIRPKLPVEADAQGFPRGKGASPQAPAYVLRSDHRRKYLVRFDTDNVDPTEWVRRWSLVTPTSSLVSASCPPPRKHSKLLPAAATATSSACAAQLPR